MSGIERRLSPSFHPWTYLEASAVFVLVGGGFLFGFAVLLFLFGCLMLPC